MGALRQTTLSYLFGDGSYIKSRAHPIPLTAYFLHYPNSTLNFKTTRDIINASSISVKEKNEIIKKFDDAKLKWKPIIFDVLQRISDTIIAQEEKTVVDSQQSDLDCDLPDGPGGSMTANLHQYTMCFTRTEYLKFRAQPQIKDMKSDMVPLAFMKIYHGRFPYLAKVSNIIFNCPASSCSIERLFSEISHMLSATANRLTAKRIFEKIVTKHADNFITSVNQQSMLEDEKTVPT